MKQNLLSSPSGINKKFDIHSLHPSKVSCVNTVQFSLCTESNWRIYYFYSVVAVRVRLSREASFRLQGGLFLRNVWSCVAEWAECLWVWWTKYPHPFYMLYLHDETSVKQVFTSSNWTEKNHIKHIYVQFFMKLLPFILQLFHIYWSNLSHFFKLKNVAAFNWFLEMLISNIFSWLVSMQVSKY